MSQSPRFYDEYSVAAGGWIRAFPVGTFKRGERTLEITPAKLAEMAANFERQLTGYKLPINLEHKAEHGRVGVIQAVEARPDGLYILPDEEAAGVIGSRKFGYVSPEVVWSDYANAKGETADNVLVGLGLTNQPFFGEEVALFSMGDLVYPDAYRDYNAEERKKLADEGKALPDGSFPIVDKADLENAIRSVGRASNAALAKRHIIKRARALGATDMLPADWLGTEKHGALPVEAALGIYNEALRYSGQETLAPAAVALFSNLLGGNMADEKKTDTQAQPEAQQPAVVNVSAPTAEKFDAAAEVEKYKAQIEAQYAQKFAALEAENKTVKEQFGAVVRDLEAQKYSARVRAATDWMTENMAHLTVADRDVFAALLVDAEDKLDAKQVETLKSTLQGASTAIQAGELFSRKGSAAGPVGGASEFEQLVASKLKANEKMSYPEAVGQAARERPDLYAKTAGGRV